MSRFTIIPLVLFCLCPGGLASAQGEAKAGEKKAPSLNKKCPISKKAADPKITADYEAKAYAFCCEKCVGKFKAQRETSVYHRIGGKAAVSAAVDLFYKKVLADDRVDHFFEDVNMKRQHTKQKAFISAALGSPVAWKGKDMRKAHANLEITEKDFGVIAGHLQKTLEELEVKRELIDEAMAIIATTKDDVLNREAQKGEKATDAPAE